MKDVVPVPEGTDVFGNNAEPMPKSDIVALPGVVEADGFETTLHCFFKSQTFLLRSFCILSLHLFPRQPPLFGNNNQHILKNPVSPFLLLHDGAQLLRLHIYCCDEPS
eukprot:CAMPEP_0172479808 /NCGR_PEP_ID=MMETSP1066-20121228/4628_1 /TAXON_ID=671091 /ORGANISM="Coscinodiscus wailesii, Strain CCMP2513" /LENGTH=107 /DNA_ID=CAMNT_0013240597 /DNA_START=46 /DNA_END=365 /DNA_ORIENTATION=-